uniref:Ribosome assembly factor mrt4 n=1 Tax=Octactis speculum TaxID=3111310 RepID=A0A7S2DHV0_9STRA|mmetsp:Transcript_48576/g.66146  ORF Transcript_48576/g.66146 Transcript_48576/m.66146 type:complete len:225 (+) Transcript_48576:25-699(+)|eukprot:CAMPEP_0185743058 /NCGR_PEP_ID=MMETSP1174-20130828/616_1 /TAXON_ID=35687 /ORGANISM="Dictyocha speculum, Strain CCMP1381" /LENGTH=224 /DNA_ID=CAMNT_0028415447 /DNA_START=25 /DNA_END=699 /DNA_ORIENTATION=+
MPKSKRDREVPLTQVKKKDYGRKGELVSSIREAVDTYGRLYVFEFADLRSTHMATVRSNWRDSRLFLGKNKIMQIALGSTPEAEYQDNLRSVSKMLRGNTGILCTNRPHDEVLGWFNDFLVDDFAQQGFVAPYDITLERGPLQNFHTSMMADVRKLGLSATINNGALHLLDDFIVCQEGQPISAEQAKVLVILDRKLAQFRVTLRCHWCSGEFEELSDAGMEIS